MIDDGKNPDEFTRDVINSCIAKNQITKGKTDAFKVAFAPDMTYLYNYLFSLLFLHVNLRFNNGFCVYLWFYFDLTYFFRVYASILWKNLNKHFLMKLNLIERYVQPLLL